MKLTLLFPLFFYGVIAHAQSAPELEGKLVQSVTLVFEDKVAGHFRLTDNQQPGETKNVYTVTLLGNDLQPIGNKVYRSSHPLTFEGIAYNGTYLGVLFKPKNDARRYVDLLDAAGETVSRDTVNYGNLYHENKGLFLVPTREGFISCVASSNGVVVNFSLAMVASDGVSEEWRSTFANKKYSYVPNLLSMSKGKMLLEVERIKRNNNRSFKDVYCIDTQTGKLIFKDESEDSSFSRSAERFSAGTFHDGHAVTLKSFTRISAYKMDGFELSRYNDAGELLDRKKIADDVFFDKVLTENNMPPLGEYERIRVLNYSLNKEGIATVVYEVNAIRDKNGKKLSLDYEYRDAYVLTLSSVFEPGPVVKVEKDYFQLRYKDISALTPMEDFRLKRRLSQGKYDKLALEDLVALHDGPFGFTHSVSGRDYTSNYFFDRTFTEKGVLYKGIRVATFIDGEFQLDFVPLKNNPDFIRVGHAQDGYLKLYEYKYGKGLVDTRLERLSY